MLGPPWPQVSSKKHPSPQLTLNLLARILGEHLQDHQMEGSQFQAPTQN